VATKINGRVAGLKRPSLKRGQRSGRGDGGGLIGKIELCGSKEAALELGRDSDGLQIGRGRDGEGTGVTR